MCFNYDLEKLKKESIVESHSHEENDDQASIAVNKIKLFSCALWTMRHVGFIRTEDNLGFAHAAWGDNFGH